MTDAATLTSQLRSWIPLTAAMQVEARECGPRRVSLAAPLAPNLNIHGTGFAGSLATLATVCGWSLAREAGLAAGLTAAWVIRASRCEFLAPARGELLASAELSARTWASFARRAAAGPRPRLRITCRVHSQGAEVLVLQGTFVALVGAVH